VPAKSALCKIKEPQQSGIEQERERERERQTESVSSVEAKKKKRKTNIFTTVWQSIIPNKANEY